VKGVGAFDPPAEGEIILPATRVRRWHHVRVAALDLRRWCRRCFPIFLQATGELGPIVVPRNLHIRNVHRSDHTLVFAKMPEATMPWNMMP
jgi:hypothetical protein